MGRSQSRRPPRPPTPPHFMNAQSELSFEDPSTIDRALLAALCAWLRRQAGPRTAAQCCAGLDLAVTEGNKRLIRSLAEHSCGAIISGPGIPYRHAGTCTVEEAVAAARSHESQARRQARRAADIRNYQHRRLHISN